MNKMKMRLFFMLMLLCAAGGLRAIELPESGKKYVLAVKREGNWYAMTSVAGKSNSMIGIQIYVDETTYTLRNIPIIQWLWTVESATEANKFYLKSVSRNLYLGYFVKNDKNVKKEDVAKLIFEDESSKKAWEFKKSESEDNFMIKSDQNEKCIVYQNNEKYFKNYEITQNNLTLAHKFHLFEVPKERALVLQGNDWTAEKFSRLDLTEATSVDFRKLGDIPEDIALPEGTNPNCLFYIKETQTLPDAFKNVVLITEEKSEAETITLVDGHDFYNNYEFTAKQISYSRHLYEGWSTLSLPFNYELRGERCEKFDSFSDNSISFTPVTTDQLDAYQPYLIYRTSDGDVKFSAANVTVPVAEIVTTVFRSNFVTFTMANSSSLYKLKSDGTEFNHSSGNAKIGAFRAYIDLGTKPEGAEVLRVVHTRNDETSLTRQPMLVSLQDGSLTIQSDEAKCVYLYDMTGLPVWRLSIKPGLHSYDIPLKGLFIMNGQKFYINK